jgi:Spy/CpxP family protein refolding chaperone
MRRVGVLVLVLGAAAMTAAPAWAQRGGGGGRGGPGGGGPMFLLTQKSVQDELKLAPDQVEKIKELAQKQQEAFAGLRDLSQEERQAKMREMRQANDKALAEVLKPEQMKRLRQINLQQMGAMALGNAETAKTLGLTDEQKEKIKAIGDDARKEMQELRQSGGDPDDVRKKTEEIRKSSGEKMMAVLTDEQKAKWKELAGEPFKGEIRRPGPRSR